MQIPLMMSATRLGIGRGISVMRSFVDALVTARWHARYNDRQRGDAPTAPNGPPPPGEELSLARDVLR